MEGNIKVLVIHGSPHQGNTMKLTRKFEETMKKHGDIHFEYLSVSELSIGMCRGCFNCITKGENLCPLQNDDVKRILIKMDEAHGVVIAAPTYMYNIPAVMKNLIDRLSYLGHRPRYLNKHAKEMFPADYKFYHENKDSRERYYLKSAKIGIFTTIASQILALIISMSMRKSRNKSDMQQKFLDW